MNKYQNRREAGKVLAQHFSDYANRGDVIVLALTSGGVPVAYEMAQKLHVPMDIFIVRKLGVPGHSDLAMGAIAMGGVHVFNDYVIRDLHISNESIKAVLYKEHLELQRKDQAYRGDHTFPVLKDKTIILVDDGMTTGASMRAAIKSLKLLHPKGINIAVPVADRQMCHQMQPLVDLLVCPLQPHSFQAVDEWYEDFSQTEDAEVFTLLKEARVFPRYH